MCEGHMDEPTEIAIAHVTVKYDAAPNSGEATERGVWGGGLNPPFVLRPTSEICTKPMRLFGRGYPLE